MATSDNVALKIKISECSVDFIEKLLQQDGIELIKFNSKSPRLADTAFSTEVIREQIMELDRIVKENKIKEYEWEDRKKVNSVEEVIVRTPVAKPAETKPSELTRAERLILKVYDEEEELNRIIPHADNVDFIERGKVWVRVMDGHNFYEDITAEVSIDGSSFFEKLKTRFSAIRRTQYSHPPR